MDDAISCIPVLLSRSHPPVEGRSVINPAAKTLSFEHADLDFRHIQSTTLRGRVRELEPIKIGLIWPKELVEAGGLCVLSLSTTTRLQSVSE